jgi:hypothetical protein
MTVGGLRTVTGFVGVYDADGGVRGELAYVVGKAVGRAHCSLCDITHSPIRRKRQWDEMVASLRVPFPVVHRNQQSPDVAGATGDRLPAVLARVDSGYEVVLGPDGLAPLGGRVDAFRAALQDQLAARGLVLGSG